MKKKYYVLWTYSANFSKMIEVMASSPKEARDIVTGHFSNDFHTRGNVYIFDCQPVLITEKKE